MALTRRVSSAFVLLAAAALLPTEAYVRPLAGARSLRMQVSGSKPTPSKTYVKEGSFAPKLPNLSSSHTKFLAEGAALLAPLVLFSNEAAAKGGEYGVLEGRSVALVHPIMMGTLFLLTGYSGYLGWQWRSVRTIAQEISSLKEGLPTLSDGSRVSTPVSKQVAALEAALKAEDISDSKAASLKIDIGKLRSAAVAEIDARVSELSESRKALVAGDFRDRHWRTGSIVLALGVTMSIAGGFDTYFRAGKLFPGPHLFAGAAVTVLWAIAASLVPSMQKGEEWARSLHIALNAIGSALFVWQVVTGLPILFKVVELTKWP